MLTNFSLLNTANTSVETKAKYDYVELIYTMLSEIQNEFYEKDEYHLSNGDNSNNFGNFLSILISLLSHQLSFINQLEQILSSLSDDIQYKPTIVNNLIKINKDITTKKIESLLSYVADKKEVDTNDTPSSEINIQLSNKDIIDKLKSKNFEQKKELVSIHVSDSPINKSLSEISFDMEKQIVKSASMISLTNNQNHCLFKKKIIQKSKKSKSCINSSNNSYYNNQISQQSSRNCRRENSIVGEGQTIKKTTSMHKKRYSISFNNTMDMDSTKNFYKNIKNVKSRYNKISVGKKNKGKNTPQDTIPRVVKCNLKQFININK